MVVCAAKDHGANSQNTVYENKNSFHGKCRSQVEVGIYIISLSMKMELEEKLLKPAPTNSDKMVVYPNRVLEVCFEKSWGFEEIFFSNLYLLRSLDSILFFSITLFHWITSIC